MIETMPPGRQARMAWRSAPPRSVSERGRLLDPLDGVQHAVRPVGLHADGVDDRVRPAAAGEHLQLLDDVGVLVEVDDVGRARTGCGPSRAGSRYWSIAITCSAPSITALAMANWPTGPAPKTAIDSPPLMSQKSAPMKPVGRMSERNSTCSSVQVVLELERADVGVGHARVLGLPAGVAAGQVPVAEDPGASSGRTSSRRIPAFGLEFSHTEYSSCWQAQQLPQAIGNGTTTRSPTLTFGRLGRPRRSRP